MFVCSHCRFVVELDDVVVRFTSGRVFCLRCYEHETLTAKPVPAELRRWVVEAAGT